MGRLVAAIFALACCALAFASRGNAQQSVPAASPSAQVTAPATESPAASPLPPATTAPAVTPSPTYRFVFVPSPAPDAAGSDAPRIREIDVTDSVLYAPCELHVRVLTSDAVVSVTAGTLGRDIAIPPRAAGIFAFDGYIPNVPDFVRNRAFDVAFVASAADGRATTVTLSLTLK